MRNFSREIYSPNKIRDLGRETLAWTIGNGDPMHEVCIYPTHYTSSIETVRMKQEEETDTRIMKENSKKYGRKEKSQTRPNYSAKDQTIKLPESPYHRLD